MILDAAKHLQALRTSSMLTDSFRRMYQRTAVMVRPEKVIRVLKAAGVRFVVMGTHGVSGYRKEARATQDVDVLVRRTDHKKAVAALSEAYAKLQVRETPVVTRFIDPSTDEPVIDIMKPYTRHLQLVFRHCVPV